MKIFVVGLGLIGASFAQGLSNKHDVYGFDLVSNQKALEKGYIKGNDLNEISTSDVVILSLYPKDNVLFLKQHIQLFTNKQLIMDVAGTKVEMIDEIESLLPAGYRYVSAHPMAGKEKKGIDYADWKLFNNANFIICETNFSSKNDVLIVRELAYELGFKKVSELDKYAHDRLIGFTSQLPHALAVALVNSDIYQDTSRFTGDSYRDLTRIAMINEHLWQELFFENKKVLVEEINRFESELDKLKQALISEDKEMLIELFIASTKKRSGF